MTGRYEELETRSAYTSEYFVRDLRDGSVVWVGEHIPAGGERKRFANVFFGHRVSQAQVEGDFIDIPKGGTSAVFRGLQVDVLDSGYRFDLPGIGQRTLIEPLVDSMYGNWLECGAGFYDEAPTAGSFSLTGVWQCDDGGTYYVRQIANTVVWFGEHPGGDWSNVFFGQLTGTSISGRWMDVPKGRSLGQGEIELSVTNPGTFGFQGTGLARVRATGGFGGQVWNKTDSVRIVFRLNELTIERNADIGGVNSPGDEPYLIPVYTTLGGNEYPDSADLRRFASRARPSVVSPLRDHEWGTRGDWPKNNLTWREDLLPGTVLPIPDHIGYGETELRTFSGFQPNSALARDTAMYVPGVIALEEASTRNEDIRAGIDALLDEEEGAPGIMNRVIARWIRNPRPDVRRLITQVRDAVQDRMDSAIRDSALSDLSGILGLLDPDKLMGAQFPRFSLGQLRDQSALREEPIPVSMVFAPASGGSWRVTGTLSATLGPARSANPVSELDVTFETGDEDKRGDSVVEVEIEASDGNRGPFPAHAAGEVFPGHSLHPVHIVLDPPIRGFIRALLVRWRRGPGSSPRQPDSWDLERVRIVAFDRFNRRRVLLNRQSVDIVLQRDQTLRIPV